MPKNQSDIYSKIQRKLHNYHFCYNDRRQLDIHESHYNQKVLLGIRVASFCYLTFIYGWTLIQMKTFNTDIIYLTMIGYCVTWLYFGLSIQHKLFEGKVFTSPHLCKFIEIFNELAFCAQVPITIVFWTLLFKYVLDSDITSSEFFIQCNLHSVPMLFLAIDFVCHSFCYHVRHTLFLVLLTVFYLIINMLYSLMVKPIYAPLKWVDVASYILAAGCIVAVLAVHFLARLLFRKWKLKKLNERRGSRASLLKSQISQSLSYQNQVEQKQNGESIELK